MDKPERLFLRSQQLLEIGQVDGALDTVRQALSIQPDYADAHALLALILLGKRRLYAASHEAGLAMQSEPDGMFAHFAQCRVLIAQRRFKAAGRHVDFLLQNDPANADYHRMAALLFELTGRRNAQLASLQRALECDAQDADTLAELSDYYRNQGDLDQAYRYARDALAVSPENGDALVAMGFVLLDRGDIDGAHEHAVWALHQNPEFVTGLSLLCAVKAKRSAILGVWWRYNSFLNKLGESRKILVLLLMYMVFRVSMQIAGDLHYDKLERIVLLGWLGFAAYTFISLQIFLRSLHKELQSVKLRADF